MKDTLEVRASSTPVAARCAASIRLMAESPDREAGDPAVTGTMAHKVFQRIVEGTFSYEGIADGDDDLRFLTHQFKRMWETGDPENEVPALVSFMDGAEQIVCEERLSFGGINGKMDLGFWHPTLGVFVMDWKTGRGAKSLYWPQLLTYAALYLFQADFDGDEGAPRQFHIIIADVRAGEWEARTVSFEDVTAHMAALVKSMERAASGDMADLTLYTTGRHCQWCSGAVACPAVSRDLMAFGELASVPTTIAERVNSLTVEEWGVLDQRARIAEAIIGHYKEARKARVKAMGGSVNFGDGWGLSLREQKNRNVSYSMGREVIAEVQEMGGSPDNFLKVSLSGLQDEAVRAAKEAAGGSLPRGGVGTLKKDIEGRLEAAGAISVEIIEKCVLVDVSTNEIEGENE